MTILEIQLEPPDLVDIKVLYDGVKESVEIVEQVDYLHGSAGGGDRGEAHDVAERTCR